jgi:hypothetical protein
MQPLKSIGTICKIICNNQNKYAKKVQSPDFAYYASIFAQPILLMAVVRPWEQGKETGAATDPAGPGGHGRSVVSATRGSELLSLHHQSPGRVRSDDLTANFDTGHRRQAVGEPEETGRRRDWQSPSHSL